MAWDKATRRKHGRSDGHRQNSLTDAEWAIVEPMLPPPSPRATGPRSVFDAIRSILASSCRRRLLPGCFPPFSTVRSHFRSWTRGGLRDRMIDRLRRLARDFERTESSSLAWAQLAACRFMLRRLAREATP